MRTFLIVRRRRYSDPTLMYLLAVIWLLAGITSIFFGLLFVKNLFAMEFILTAREKLYSTVSSCALLSTGALFAAGPVGLFLKRRWGYRVSILCAVLTCLVLFVGTLIGILAILHLLNNKGFYCQNSPSQLIVPLAPQDEEMR